VDQNAPAALGPPLEGWRRVWQAMVMAVPGAPLARRREISARRDKQVTWRTSYADPRLRAQHKALGLRGRREQLCGGDHPRQRATACAPARGPCPRASVLPGCSSRRWSRPRSSGGSCRSADGSSGGAQRRSPNRPLPSSADHNPAWGRSPAGSTSGRQGPRQITAGGAVPRTCARASYQSSAATRRLGYPPTRSSRVLSLLDALISPCPGSGPVSRAHRSR